MSLTTRKDATSTESQMKLAIAQTLSQSFAYNAPVVVLDFSVNDQGEFEGKFKDATRPRVFSFNIKGQSVTFKPYTPGRIDSAEDWEEFSSGYSYRVDAGVGGKKKPQCVKPTAYNCGAACINIMKSCKIKTDDPAVKDRIKKLNEIGKDYAKTTKSVDPPLIEKPAKQEEVKAQQQPPGQKVGKLTPSLASKEDQIKIAEEWRSTAKQFSIKGNKVLNDLSEDDMIGGKKVNREVLENTLDLVSDSIIVMNGLNFYAQEKPGKQDTIFLKDESGDAQGFFMIGNEKSKDSMYVEYLGTNPLNIIHSKKGVGKQIMYHAIQESIKRGLKGQIKLEALNTSESFYEAMGFQRKTEKEFEDGKYYDTEYFDLSEESAKAFVKEYEKKLK